MKSKTEPRTPLKRNVVGNSGPVSIQTDQVDEIYKAEDPIESSISIRKKGGALQTVVADKNAFVGKFFFTLKTKGTEVKISDKA